MENLMENPRENPNENPRGNPREDPKSSTWTATTPPSIKEAALRAASTKGGRRVRGSGPFLGSLLDGCMVAVQVEDFGLPKSAVGTVGQTSNIFKISPLDFKPSKSRIFGCSGCSEGSEARCVWNIRNSAEVVQ